MNLGFIQLYRDIMDEPIWTEKPFDKAHALVDLMLRVNHKENEVLIGNEFIKVEKGCHITSIRKLCDTWDWSNTKVYDFLNLLKGREMLDFYSTKKYTYISLNINNGIPRKGGDDLDRRENGNKKQQQTITENKDVVIAEPEVFDDRYDEEAIQKHTNNNEKKIINNLDDDMKLSNSEVIENILSHYCMRANIDSGSTKDCDRKVVSDLIELGVPYELIIRGINECFSNFKSDSRYKKINSLRYCERQILNLFNSINRSDKSGYSKRANRKLQRYNCGEINKYDEFVRD
jgi:hypothetical protein